MGAVALGIGNALLEELVYDDSGQLLTGTFMDYLVPTAPDVPEIQTLHTETPSPFTQGGVKGVGEAGTVGAYTAVGKRGGRRAAAPWGGSHASARWPAAGVGDDSRRDAANHMTMAIEGPENRFVRVFQEQGVVPAVFPFRRKTSGVRQSSLRKQL